MTVTSCNDDDNIVIPNENENVGKAVGNFSAAEWNPGGEKGTTSNEQGCYSNPVPQVADNADLYQTIPAEDAGAQEYEITSETIIYQVNPAI